MYTLGHYNHAPDIFVDLLKQHNVEVLCDTRGIPGSRRSPWFGGTMPVWVPNAGVEYWHVPGLGGRRKNPEHYETSDMWWENVQFRNYAAWTRSDEFQESYQRLLIRAQNARVAVMCGEPVYWRCHRRLISDLAVLDGLDVQHIMPNGTLSPHKPTEWAALIRAERVACGER